MVTNLQFLIARGKRAVLLEAVDQTFDRVALAVGALIEADAAARFDAAARDDRADVASAQITAGAVPRVRLVADDPRRPGAGAAPRTADRAGLQQQGQHRPLVAVAGRQAEDERLATPLAAEVDLRRKPALTAPERLITAPFLAPAACWWARTMVESSRCTDQSRSPAASPAAVSAAKMRSQIPACCQRRKREYTVCHGPYRSGKSRHGAPVRSRQRMPLSTVRWSWLGRPVSGRAGGSNGSSRAHCSSVSSCRRCGLIHQGYHRFANT